MNLLEAKNLKVVFWPKRSMFAWAKEQLRAVDDVSFAVEAGETLGLVGESGCGKTTLGRAVIRLIPCDGGNIVFDGEDITNVTGKQLREQRRKFQMIFQDPFNSLNPRMNVGQIIGEAIDAHGLSDNADGRWEKIESLLKAVGLEPAYARRYPREFSGGQRQRIGIARALAVEPKLIVCDEPVSAVDVSIQAQIVTLLQDLQAERGLAYLLISHDLAVVEHMSRRILVMYLGKVVESGDSNTIVSSPQHPYTQALVSAVPTIEPGTKRKRMVLGGDAPSPINPPSGCPFHPRCPLAETRCKSDAPALREIAPGHFVSCHLA